jgi:hypothetical protein
MNNPLVSAQELQNPTVHASPWRYSSADGRAAPERNRRPAWFGQFVSWAKIAGDRLEVRGHEPEDEGPDAAFEGPDAAFYDAGANPPAPISADGSYRIAKGGPASHTITLKQISTIIDVRDFVQDSLSEDYSQTEFARQAAEFAIRAKWEEAAIVGDAGVSSAGQAEFDGLQKLIARGHGRVRRATRQPLSDIDQAMSQVLSHNRRVDLILMNQVAWVKLLALERSCGYRPDTRRNGKIGFEISYYNGVPVCLSDHIPVHENKTSLFVMSLGEPNGVFAIVNKDAPEIVWNATHAERTPAMIHQAHLYSALVSATDDALVEVQDWSVAL